MADAAVKCLAALKEIKGSDVSNALTLAGNFSKIKGQYDDFYAQNFDEAEEIFVSKIANSGFGDQIGLVMPLIQGGLAWKSVYKSNQADFDSAATVLSTCHKCDELISKMKDCGVLVAKIAALF
jgi:hypothetical protein